MTISSRSKKAIVIGLVTIFVVGIVIWQFSKKTVLKNIITESVTKSTEGFYKVNYDSSNIDELAGNASFFGLSFKADSLQFTQKNLDSLPAVVIDTKIKEVKFIGADIPSFLTKNSISTQQLIIESPVITIYQNSKSEVLTKADSVALYKSILGKFSSIKANKIKINNAQIMLAKINGQAHTKFSNVNIELNNLLINEEKKFDDIISYFIKDLAMTVAKFESNPPATGKEIIAEGISFNAKTRIFEIDKAGFVNKKNGNEKTILNGIKFSGLNTNAFVYQNKLLADSLSIEGGQVFIHQTKNSKTAGQSFEIENDFFTRAQLKNLFINATDITVIPSKVDEKPVLLRKVKFVATNLPTLDGNNSLQQILNAGNWSLHSDGVDLTTKDGLYAVKLKNLDLNDVNKNLKIAKITMLPLMSWGNYVKNLKTQHDYYEVTINNLFLSGLSTNELINDGKLTADLLSLSPNIKSSNDRTIPFDKTSKVGMYPHQQLMAMELPIDIKKVNIVNGWVTYRERGRLSNKVGDVVFKKINGSITGVTNTASGIAKEKNMVLDAKAEFLSGTTVNTKWTMPLQKLGGNNIVTGNFSSINTTALNKVIEPLGMASIRKGTIDGLQFKWSGNDYKSTGEATLLYHNLKIDVLKSGDKTDNDLEKKDLLSFAANVLIKNSNPRNGNTRSSSMENSRDTTKSYFNFIFKSILAASKRTLLKSL